jgi:plasmid maintenance system killer protein
MFEIIELDEYKESKGNCSISEQFEKIIRRKIEFLAQNPRHPSLECHEYHMDCKVNGKEAKIWSFYVNRRQYRIDFVYAKGNKIYLVNFSFHHQTSEPKSEYIIEEAA